MGCHEADVAVDVVVNEGQASHPFRYLDLECTRFYDPKGATRHLNRRATTALLREM